MQGLTTIHLGGKLGQLFGKRWELMVKSPAEAIRAIDVNLKGKLRQYLAKEGAKKFYKVAVGKKDALLDKNELNNRSGHSPIYIMPAAKGANSGGAKIFAGIALIALAVVSGGTSLAATGFLGGFASTAALVGASLVLGGITQMLTPTPNFNQNAEGDSRGDGSTFFQGGSTSISQGGAVGLVYGRALVTPMPISISTNNTDRSKPDVAGVIDYCTTTDENGLVQYPPLGEGEVCP